METDKCNMCDNKYIEEYVSYIHKNKDRSGYTENIYPRYFCCQNCLDEYNKKYRCNMCHVAIEKYKEASDGFNYCDEIMVGNNTCYNKLIGMDYTNIEMKILDLKTKVEYDINNIPENSVIIIKIIFKNNVILNIFEPYNLIDTEYKKTELNDFYDGKDVRIEIYSDDYHQDCVVFFERNNEFVNIGLTNIEYDNILMSTSILFEYFKPIIKQIIQIGNLYVFNKN